MVPVTKAISNLAEAFSLAYMQLVRPGMYSLSISSGFLLGLSTAIKLRGMRI